VKSVNPKACVKTWTGVVHLKEDKLPNLKKWRGEFRSIVGDLFTLHGVEAVLDGRLIEVKGEPMLKLEKSKAMLRLQPLKEKVQWDPKQGCRQPPTASEKEAHGRLLARWAKHAGPPPRVRIVGPLRESAPGESPVVTVREFAWDAEPQGDRKEPKAAAQPEPAPLPADVVAAWTKAGAEVGRAAGGETRLGKTHRTRVELEFADGKLKVIVFKENATKRLFDGELRVLGDEAVKVVGFGNFARLNLGGDETQKVEVYYDFVGEKVILVCRIGWRPWEGFPLSGEYTRAARPKLVRVPAACAGRREVVCQPDRAPMPRLS
jgi:hypothetical protein